VNLAAHHRKWKEKGICHTFPTKLDLHKTKVGMKRIGDVGGKRRKLGLLRTGDCEGKRERTSCGVVRQGGTVVVASIEVKGE